MDVANTLPSELTVYALDWQKKKKKRRKKRKRRK